MKWLSLLRHGKPIAAAIFAFYCIFPAAVAQLAAQQNFDPLGVIIGHYAPLPSDFTTGAIPRADLERIIQAGIRAPSANNRQPWYFTVVQSQSLAQKIVPQTQEGNVLIVVSAVGDGITNSREILDCALATQSIYLAAQALGYGSRIYTSPVEALNKKLKSELGFPGRQNAVAVVRVGKITPSADAVSAASKRDGVDKKVTYK
jgi:nitroreductase